MKLIEPISRKLNLLGKACLSVLSKKLDTLDINNYYYVLASIYFSEEPLTQKALANIMDKDKSSMVNIIDALTESGYVYREVNLADRREHLIKLTPKAIEAVPEIIEAFNFLNKNVTAGISKQEMETFYSVLQKMENNIKPLLNTALNIKPAPIEPISL